MAYIVERDVKIEIVDESDGVMREAGYGIAELGRCSIRMPDFTDEELKAALGDTYEEIKNIFGSVQPTSNGTSNG